MRPEFVKALETRLEWLEWGKRQGGNVWEQINGSAHAMPQFIEALEYGETFVMDSHFCRLVDHARRTVPDTMVWDPTWLVRPHGWMWMEEPVLLPDLKVRGEIAKARKAVLEAITPLDKEAAERVLKQTAEGLGLHGPVKEHWFEDDPGMRFRALGWRSFPPGSRMLRGSRLAGGSTEEYITDRPSTQFLCYQSFADYSFGKDVARLKKALFGSWSYFLLKEGDQLGPRLKEFEDWTTRTDSFAKYEARTEAPLHEMRWIYTAMYMMGQRLAVRVRHDTDRPTRRRAERKQQVAPPFITVVTLRRLEAHRPRMGSEPREWNFQWEVRGHWRNQWYAKERVHKPKFIEAFVKGPADKPFKEPGTKLFVARR